MKKILNDVSAKAEFIIDTLEVDKDHIHLLVSSTPNLSVVQIVRKLKQESTFTIWKYLPQLLRRYFWKENTFWSNGYFVSTLGKVSTETVRRYIKNQG